MKITIKNITAFRLAQAATSKKDFQAIFRGVAFYPDGRLAGSDGFTLAHSKDAHTWEGGDDLENIVLQFEKALPKSATGEPVIDVDLESGKGIMEYQTSRGRAVIAVTVLAGRFPDYEQAVGVDTPDVAVEATTTFANVEYMYRFVKVLGDAQRNSIWKFRKVGDILYLPVDENTEAIVVALRTKGKRKVIPLDTDEGAEEEVKAA